MKMEHGKKSPSSKTVSRVVIEPAEGGFIVTCEYEGGKEPMYSKPVKKVAKNVEELYDILEEKLG